MNYREILDQLELLTAKVEELQKGKVFEEEDIRERIIDSDDDRYVLKADGGYASNVDTLCVLTDTGNGYIAYFPTYNSIDQDNYICMNYSEADYLRKMLSYIHKKTSEEV